MSRNVLFMALVGMFPACSLEDSKPYPQAGGDGDAHSSEGEGEGVVGEGEGEGEGEGVVGEGEGEGTEGEGEGAEGEGPVTEGEGEGAEGEGEGPVCACVSNEDCDDGNFCNGVETCDCTCSPGTPPDCADEFECTEDRCTNNECVNVPAHARCGAGKICKPDAGGCVAPPPCRDDADCVPDDPCQTGACEAATRSCAFAPFDGDEDGHAPIVCGGDDCDDSTNLVRPDEPERCNQKDDNCNGEVDEGFDLRTDRRNCGECGNVCPEDRLCGNDTCLCPGEQTDCDGDCVNTRIDEQHCGECWHQCPDGADCNGGECACRDPEQTACGGDCTWLSLDEENCGECGNQCPEEAECRNSECACVHYWSGGSRYDCDGGCLLCDDWCSHNDEENCGECGNRCNGGMECVAGICRCPHGFEECGGFCTDLMSSSAHCGQCGNACDENLICRNGSCQCPEEGSVVCPDIGCTDIANDNQHCGSCDNTCPARAPQDGEMRHVSCGSGLCQCFFDRSLDEATGTICDGETCTDLDWDLQNCGECGQVCSYGERCAGGGRCICDGQGFEVCGDICTNTVEDPENCGECNHRCAIGEGCFNARCVRCQDFPGIRCGDYCFDVFYEQHCWECNHRCAQNEACGWRGCEPRE